MNWLPPNGALHGIALDKLLGWNLAIIFWLFVAAHLLIVAAFLFRRARTADRRERVVVPTEVRPQLRTDEAEGPGLSELSKTPSLTALASARSSNSIRTFLLFEALTLLALTALYLAMDITGHKLWAASREQNSASHPIEVEVTGAQFQWYFRYPGPDAVYGATKPTLVSAPTGNPLGLDPADPHSADDVVSSILILPANQPIHITLRSEDVIHGFFVPGMRLKQDAIPGMPGDLRFTPITPGDYDILCSQVCGLGHYRMQARLRIVTETQFETWLAARQRITAEPAR